MRVCDVTDTPDDTPRPSAMEFPLMGNRVHDLGCNRPTTDTSS